MALTTSRVQYLAVRAARDVFWMRDKNCCTVSIGNLTPKKSIHNKISNPDLEPKDLDYGSKIMSEQMTGAPTPISSDIQDPSIDHINDTKYPPTMKEKQMLKLLVNELKVKKELIWNEIMKHPKRKFLNLCQIEKSLKFLQHLGFSKQEIAETPAICFYPERNIETGLEEIKKNAVELNKLGYVNGFLKVETTGFLCGSKSKDKRLQLCLYYMELPFDFNGNGIFDIDECSDVYNSETEQ